MLARWDVDRRCTGYPLNSLINSFDVVSDFNYHEVTNAVDQSNREITTRFDFKGTNSNFSLEENSINLTSESEFQLQQMLDILKQKLAKRGVNI